MSGESDGEPQWLQGAVKGVRRVRRGLVETAHALMAERRAIVLAAIGALICLLLADLLGASDDGKTLAAISGAIAGKALDVLDKRFRWGEERLAAIAALLALFKFPRVRDWLLGIERPVRSTSIQLSRAATRTASVGSMIVGAVAAIGVVSVFAGDSDRGSASAGESAQVFATPEQAIAAFLARTTVQYVGPCNGGRIEPPDGRGSSDRRVCSVRKGAQDSGVVYGYVSSGGRTHSPRADPGAGTDLVILREDRDGWRRVGCFTYCADPRPPQP